MLVYVAVLLWMARDELPFLHPGKVSVDVLIDEEVTDVYIGEHKLNTSLELDTIWLSRGTYELKIFRPGNYYSETLDIKDETYIVLDGNPPYGRD